ncbi:Ig-like domain-containing protein, partial [Pantoea endophytica]
AGAPSAAFDIVIVGDNATVTITDAFDDAGSFTGALGNGALTDDATPTFQGRAEANSQVVIRYTLAGGAAASVTVDADSTGRWSWTPGTGLAAGQWSFDVKSLGQTHWNDSFDLIIVSESDGGFAPVIDYAVDDFGPVTGNLGSGSSTDDSTPALHGRAEANNLVILRYTLGDGRYASASIKADAGGNWSWTPPELASGSWTFEVKKSGQMDWSSFTLTIDPNADRNASIDSALDNAGPVTGSLSSGASTDDTTPTLRGSGPASSVITLRYKMDGGSYASTTVSVDNAGNWSWTPDTLTKGSWTFEVQKAGQSDWSSFTLTIDPDLDRYPTIDSALDNVGPVTGSLSSGATTDDTTPTLRGTGPANSSITLKYSNGDRSGGIIVKVDASGNWTWTAPDLEDGHWTFEVKKDGQENWSRYELTIDSNADRNASIDSAFDNVGPMTGSLSSGSSTDDTTPTLRGSGPSNGTITLRYKLGSGSYASTTVSVDNAGNWSWTPSGLAKGSWT